MAAATVDMSVLTRSFRTALGENAGQFRKASNDNAVNFSKIVKDISAMFKAQRGDIAELTNAVQESVSESQQTSAKIDSLTSVFREGLTLQSEMTAYLKTISGNIKILNDSVVTMSNQLVGTGTNSLLSALTNPTNGIANSLKIAGIGAAAGAVGAAAVSSMMGGGDYKMGAGETASGQQVVSGLMSRGFSKEESSAIAGNISAESSFKTGVTNSIGAFGLMQWLGSRKQQLFEFAKSQNKDPSDLNLQLDFIKKELKGGGQETNAFNRAVAESGGDVSKLAYLFGKYVERPSDAELAQSSSRRVNVATKLYGTAGQVTAPTTSSTTLSQATPTTTPTNTAAQTTPSKEEAPPPSATASRYEGPGAESHGPIGKEQHAEKTAGSTALPSGDIVALGKALQGMNINVSEHPAFGGVNPGKHYPNSAHNDGMAIDINGPPGTTEASDPVWGRKFDELAKQIQAAGYTVLWRTRGHYDHIHAQIGGKGIRGGHSSIGGATTPDSAATPTTPGSSGTTAVLTPSSSGETATPVSQASMVPGVSAGISGNQMSSMMGMMGGMIPGGMGGMIGSLIPMIGNLLGSLGSMEAPAMAPQEFASQQNPIAELLQSLSGSTAPGEMMNQAAVQKQAQQETSQEIMAMGPQPEQRKPAETTIASNSMGGGGDGYAYNQPGDIGWPEWASMIGGNHWSEMKKYKQNMWG